MSAGIVNLEFGSTAVDDHGSTGNGHRGFGDVGGQNNSLDAIWRGNEHFTLFGYRCGGMQSMHGVLGTVGKVDRQR